MRRKIARISVSSSRDRLWQPWAFARHHAHARGRQEAAAAALAGAQAADGVLLVRGARARAGGRGIVDSRYLPRPAMKERPRWWKALSEQEQRVGGELGRRAEGILQITSHKAALPSWMATTRGRRRRRPAEDYNRMGAVDEQATLELPISRVARARSVNKDVLKTSKDADFAMAKTTQFFAERCVKEAAAGTARQGRTGRCTCAVVPSMKNCINPEAMHVFVEKFQVPNPDAKKPKKKSAVRRRRPPSNFATPAARRRRRGSLPRSPL